MDWLVIEESFAYWFAAVVRIIWCYIAIRSTYLAYHEYRLNKSAYDGGRYLKDGKRIIRRGRFLRSRWFLASFSIAAAVGVFATIGFFRYPPVAETTNIISIVSTILIVIMLYGFEQAKETDVDMRQQAREFKRMTEDPLVEQRVGEEIVHPPIDIKDVSDVEDPVDAEGGEDAFGDDDTEDDISDANKEQVDEDVEEDVQAGEVEDKSKED